MTSGLSPDWGEDVTAATESSNTHTGTEEDNALIFCKWQQILIEVLIEGETVLNHSDVTLFITGEFIGFLGFMIFVVGM